MEVNVNIPWFSEITFKVNSLSIENRASAEYRSVERQAEEIRDALTQLHTQVREAATRAATPRASVKCPFCSAVVIPDASGNCPFYDSAIGI